MSPLTCCTRGEDLGKVARVAGVAWNSRKVPGHWDLLRVAWRDLGPPGSHVLAVTVATMVPGGAPALVLLPRGSGLDLHELPFELVEPALGEDLLARRLVREGDETKTSASAREVVLENLALRDLAKLLKVLAKVFVRGIRAEAADEDLPALGVVHLGGPARVVLARLGGDFGLHDPTINGVLVITSLLRLAPRAQGHETKAPRAKRPGVTHDRHLDNLSVLLEDALQGLLGGLPGQAANEEFYRSVQCSRHTHNNEN